MGLYFKWTPFIYGMSDSQLCPETLIWVSVRKIKSLFFNSIYFFMSLKHKCARQNEKRFKRYCCESDMLMLSSINWDSLEITPVLAQAHNNPRKTRFSLICPITLIEELHITCIRPVIQNPTNKVLAFPRKYKF